MTNQQGPRRSFAPSRAERQQVQAQPNQGGPVEGAGLSQMTAVEMSRATAEVMVAAELAARFPRDWGRAQQRMHETFADLDMAQRTEYSRDVGGGQTAEDLSVDAARELARCAGHFTYGITELSRNGDQSEMLAFAWDLGDPSAPNRATRTYIVQHVRDRGAAKGGPVPLTKQIDIMTLTTAMASRALRECILSLLPHWYREEARQIARETIARSQAAEGQTTIGDRAAASVRAYAQQGITEQQLVRFLDGVPRSAWGEEQVVKLQTLWRSLRDRVITLEQAFPKDEPPAAATPDAGAPTRAQALAGVERRPAEVDPVTGQSPAAARDAAVFHGGGRSFTPQPIGTQQSPEQQTASEPTEDELAAAYEREQLAAEHRAAAEPEPDDDYDGPDAFDHIDGPDPEDDR